MMLLMYICTMSFTVFLDPNMVSLTTAVTLPRHFTRFFSPGWMNAINQCLCRRQWLRHIESLVSLISQTPKPDEPAKSLASPSPMSIYRTSLRNICIFESHVDEYQTERILSDWGSFLWCDFCTFIPTRFIVRCTIFLLRVFTQSTTYVCIN